ncbi:20276_t:CDS:2 [Rhizophagus irregularis]|nr:20276_t:CDS:2 [Rhizophagus irregularis]
MENQESSVNLEAITADEINMDPIGNTQRRDIYEVQPRRNKSLKSIALNILKYLPEDILREEPDFSSIKSNNTIPDYGPCGECSTPILAEDPPRALVLNVCGDMIHWTCAKTMYKDGTLLCSCGKADNSDPLLPFQYSIVDYGDKAGIISNPDPRMTSQSSGISPSMGTFALSSPPIRMLGIEGPVTQQDKSTLRCAKCSEDLSSSLPPLGFLRIAPQPQVTNNFETQGSSTTQNKRTMEPASTEKSSSKKQKTLTNVGESPTLKRLIKELATPSSASSTTDTQPTIADRGNLTDLYNAILTAEEKNRATNQEIILRYYSFGEELENMFDRFKSLHRDRKAQRMLVKEVTKQLPSDLSKNTIEKRIERARKIYDLFSTIGFEKIQRVKTPVSHIYGLSWEDIDTLGEKFR